MAGVFAAVVALAAFSHQAPYRHAKTTGTYRRLAEPLLRATKDWEAGAVQEPTVIRQGKTWRMWFTGGWSVTGIEYATCKGDPTRPGCWRQLGHPVIGHGGSGTAGNAQGGNITYRDGVYRIFYYHGMKQSDLMEAASRDGIHWGRAHVAIPHDGVSWMTGWANSFAWYDHGWKMLAEGASSPTGNWQIAYATSSDGNHWTPRRLLPSLKVPGLDNYGGPWLTSTHPFRLLYHAGSGNYTDIYTATSLDGLHWRRGPAVLAANGGRYEAQQVADASLVDGLLFYDGVDNGTGHSYIDVAGRRSARLELACSSCGD